MPKIDFCVYVQAESVEFSCLFVCACVYVLPNAIFSTLSQLMSSAQMKVDTHVPTPRLYLYNVCNYSSLCSRATKMPLLFWDSRWIWWIPLSCFLMHIYLCAWVEGFRKRWMGWTATLLDDNKHEIYFDQVIYSVPSVPTHGSNIFNFNRSTEMTNPRHTIQPD